MVLIKKQFYPSVFSIWKSLQVIQKGRTKIVAHAIYTHLFFSYTYTPLLLENKNS